MLLMRQWCQSFNHLFRVTHNFEKNKKQTWPATLAPWPAPEPLAGPPGPLAGP